MSDTAEFISTFAARFAFASTSDGCGVLVDLQVGSYFALNTTASMTCGILRSSRTVDEALKRVAEEMGIGISEAQEAVLSIQRELSRAAPRENIGGPLQYARATDGSWALQENSRTILSIDAREQVVRLHVPPSDLLTRSSSTCKRSYPSC